MAGNDLEIVASFTRAFDARLAAAHLEAAGIASSVATDDAGGVIPSMTGLAAGAVVLVRAEDVDEARRILSEEGGLPD